MKIQPTQLTRIMLPSEDGFSFYDIDKIVRCEAQGEITKIYFINSDEPIPVENTINKIEEILSGLFFYRINFNHLINLNYILKYSNNEGRYIVFMDGSRISISENKIYHLIDKLKNIVRTC